MIDPSQLKKHLCPNDYPEIYRLLSNYGVYKEIGLLTEFKNENLMASIVLISLFSANIKEFLNVMDSDSKIIFDYFFSLNINVTGYYDPQQYLITILFSPKRK